MYIYTGGNIFKLGIAQLNVASNCKYSILEDFLLRNLLPSFLIVIVIFSFLARFYVAQVDTKLSTYVRSGLFYRVGVYLGRGLIMKR